MIETQGLYEFRPDSQVAMSISSSSYVNQGGKKGICSNSSALQKGKNAKAKKRKSHQTKLLSGEKGGPAD